MDSEENRDLVNSGSRDSNDSNDSYYDEVRQKRTKKEKDRSGSIMMRPSFD